MTGWIRTQFGLRRLIAMTILTAMWTALWERLSLANLLSGALVAFAVTHQTRPGAEGEGQNGFRPLAFAHFVGWFVVKLLQASAVVAWEVVTPHNKVNEGVIAVPLRGVSDGVVVTVANAISLIPGTVTIEIMEEPIRLYVHVLHLNDIDAVRSDVLRLEELVVRAFGSDEAVRQLENARSLEEAS